MFRTVVSRSLTRRSCAIPFTRLVYSIRLQSNGPKYQNWQSNNDNPPKQENQDELTKEEKNARKLKLQEELKRLQAEEDLEADAEEESKDNQKSTKSEISSDSENPDTDIANQEKEGNDNIEKVEHDNNTEARSEDHEEKIPEITSEIEETIIHDFNPDGSAEFKHQNRTTIHHGEKTNTTEQETAERSKVEEEEESLEGSMNVLATSAAVVPGNQFPQIDDKINSQIHQEIVDLPSQKEKRKSEWSKKLTSSLESLQETILKATRVLNDVTGYSSIEKLKQSIEKLEDELKDSKQNVKDAKKAYNEAIHTRSKSQREVNELLTRKHDWNSRDLERFTELYRNDHTNELQENNAQKQLAEAELKVDGVQLKLTQLILTRYHEEQIWSDKIRQASTWGTWMIMGANLLLFIVATFFVEPWKRKRLVNAFEKQVKETLVGISQDDKEIIEPVIEEINTPTKEMNPALEEIKDFAGAIVHLENPNEPTELVAEINPENTQEIEEKEIIQDQLIMETLERNWQSVKSTIITNYHTLTDSLIQQLKFQKIDFAFITAFFTLLGGSIGSILTLYFKSR